MSTLHRYRPERSFPSYAFIPGRNPHPHNHPNGHSYGVSDTPEPLDATTWHTHDGYLWGVDLYNHGYPWEAHEAWEGPWKLAVKDTPERLHLQGLIQCAAALVKSMAQQPAGVRSLSKSGTALLERVHARIADRHGQVYMGVDLLTFSNAFRSYAHDYPHRPMMWPKLKLVFAKD